jgi:hypothetical protein
MEKCCSDDNTEAAFTAMLNRASTLLNNSLECLMDRDLNWNEAVVGKVSVVPVY